MEISLEINNNNGRFPNVYEADTSWPPWWLVEVFFSGNWEFMCFLYKMSSITKWLSTFGVVFHKVLTWTASSTSAMTGSQADLITLHHVSLTSLMLSWLSGKLSLIQCWNVDFDLSWILDEGCENRRSKRYYYVSGEWTPGSLSMIPAHFLLFSGPSPTRGGLLVTQLLLSFAWQTLTGS